jgi:excisionase family DNA binding protein
VTATPDWIGDVVSGLHPLATLDETAEALRRCTRSVRRLIDSGRLAAVRDPNSSRVLVPRKAIEAYLREVSP